jgi:hypothetical protein
MPQPRRTLLSRVPRREEIQWRELRQRATIVYFWLQAGWTALTPDERREVRRLVTKSRGRPGNLNREEARRLGRLAGKAASAAARMRRR